MDQNLGGLSQGVLRMDGAVRFDLEDELFIVRLLLDTEILDRVLYVANRGENRVDGDHLHIRIGWISILIGRHIATAFAEREFHLERSARGKVTDLHFGIEHLKACRL